MQNFHDTKTYLVCYDISNPNRQAFFRQHIRQYCISGQYSTYECRLSKKHKHALIDFLLRHSVSGEDACGIIPTQSIYWQNLPKSPIHIDSSHHFLYIG